MSATEDKKNWLDNALDIADKAVNGFVGVMSKTHHPDNIEDTEIFECCACHASGSEIRLIKVSGKHRPENLYLCTICIDSLSKIAKPKVLARGE
jgi:hypothetical protein